MRLFVSYSRRDGLVTDAMLRLLDRYLTGFCTPFVHCLHGSSSRWQQLLVLRALLMSSAILLLESPATQTSGWVRFELVVGHILCRPVLRLKATDLGLPQHEV
jgi:hypothetical protein